ncbi:hypothetical protein OF83DRAFT_1171318 [Amylostereum chailletii]|nr:hypothetical protein OF83DRAFT_1171318 [Amylostereum chailletii]
MSDIIILYDIPAISTKDKSWSPNTWKTRYALNIKGLPYKTVWVDFCDVEKEMKKIGAEPTYTHPDGSHLWTVPTIYDPSTDKVVSDSAIIAAYLDAQYPSTATLIPTPTAPLQAAFVDKVALQLMMALVPVNVLDTFAQLTPRTQEWFRGKREKEVGMTLEAFAGDAERREKAIAHVVGLLDDMSKWLEAGGENGPFLTGDKPSHADTAIAGLFTWTERVGGGQNDVWKAIMGAHGGRWERFMKAFGQWETVV